MMKQFGLMLPAAALVCGLMLSGCVTAEPKSAPQLERITDDEKDDGAKTAAQEYMTKFAAAFQEKDIEKFKQVISEERRKKLTPEVFQEILAASQREQGELVNMEFLTALDQVIYQTYLWKMTYEKQDSEGKTARRDFLYFVSIGKTGENEYSVGAAGFRL